MGCCASKVASDVSQEQVAPKPVAPGPEAEERAAAEKVTAELAAMERATAEEVLTNWGEEIEQRERQQAEQDAMRSAKEAELKKPVEMDVAQLQSLWDRERREADEAEEAADKEEQAAICWEACVVEEQAVLWERFQEICAALTASGCPPGRPGDAAALAAMPRKAWRTSMAACKVLLDQTSAGANEVATRAEERADAVRAAEQVLQERAEVVKKMVEEKRDQLALAAIGVSQFYARMRNEHRTVALAPQGTLTKDGITGGEIALQTGKGDLTVEVIMENRAKELRRLAEAHAREAAAFARKQVARLESQFMRKTYQMLDGALSGASHAYSRAKEKCDEMESCVQRVWDAFDHCKLQLNNLVGVLQRIAAALEEIKQTEKHNAEAEATGKPLKQQKYDKSKLPELDPSEASVVEEHSKLAEQREEFELEQVQVKAIVASAVPYAKFASIDWKVRSEREEVVADAMLRDLEYAGQLRDGLLHGEHFEQKRRELKDLLLRTLFSFGSRHGGLDLALKLRELLLAREGWAKGSAYVDLKDLRDHRATRLETRTMPDGATAEVVLNPHWAEFYFMGALLADTICLILDSAWTDSKWCMGEWQLFMKALAKTFTDESSGLQLTSYELNMVVLWDTTAEGASEERAKQVMSELGANDCVSSYVPCIIDGANSRLADGAEAAFYAAIDMGSALREEMHARDAKKGLPTPTTHPEAYKVGCMLSYERNWRARALKLLNSEMWWA